MNSKHVKTLSAIFARPTPVSIVFGDIEALVVALGGQAREGAGSRVAFELWGTCKYMHRPHPSKEAKRYQVEVLRTWFSELGVKP
ncbi:type II toxin-antitoxin system HicA family toxin [Trinickia sp. EG282A]|uniref:type II toxin-antitoxin system HicA family toxin n=1 Tax=Trinickia sp. EG282A TaxID=3237013 RepID=UPI0034D3562E